jgi:hypothetical protein
LLKHGQGLCVRAPFLRGILEDLLREGEMAKRIKHANADLAQDEAERLEQDYADLMKAERRAGRRDPIYLENLAQPSDLRFVDSYTTYGAYEEPI